MAYEAKVIADSICSGQRLTTLQLTHPRIVHSEMMTHCAFARNASSSRAIPFAKMLERVKNDPFIPRRFGINQKGMQAGTWLTGVHHDTAVQSWLSARESAMAHAARLADPEFLNVHKGLANRLIEPWMWITVCVTGDSAAWSNYFALRCHPDADDALADQAYMAQLAYFKSLPHSLKQGEWHLPYVKDEDRVEVYERENTSEKYYEHTLVQVSTGRCARTSYLTQEGERSLDADVELHDRLVERTPLHASPPEHVCQAMGNNARYGKYRGWKSYRHMLPNEYVTNFVPNHPELVSK